MLKVFNSEKSVYFVDLQQAVSILREGGLLIYPTEAVWGIGCDPFNEQAVQAVLQLKQRDIAKGMILIGANLALFDPYVGHLPGPLRDRFATPTTTPTTWLVPDVKNIPAWVRGEHSSCACRITQHALVAELTRQFACPIISTSANPAGVPAASDLRTLEAYFGDQDVAVLSGELGGATAPSQIMDLVTQQIIRSH